MSITTPRKRSWLVALLVGAVALVGGLAASPAQAAYVANLTQAQPTNTTAGQFSNYQMAFAFSGGQAKSLTLNFPPGQLGVVNNATQCTVTNWQNDNCAASSAVGFVSTDVTAVLGISLTASGKIYRLQSAGTEVMRIGMSVSSSLSSTLYIEGTIRVRDDYGITATIPSIPNSATIEIFGIPTGGTAITIDTMTVTMYGRINDGAATANGFFFNPSECSVANLTSSSTPYSGTVSNDSAGYSPTNCAAAPFNPTLAFLPAGSPASTPTAFTVQVGTPFVANSAKMQSPLKDVAMTLPAGVQLSGAANSDGSLAACTDAQFGYGTPSAPDTCPGGAKVGTVALDSPLVGVVNGDVFLAQPAAGPNDLVQLFIVAEASAAADALRIKIRAQVAVDPATGEHTVTLTNLPEQPVKTFTFAFRAGTNPGTRQPRTCGTYGGSAGITPFSTTSATNLNANYTVTTSCPPAGKFDPTIAMTLAPTTAGATTATGVTTINLPVGDEPISSLTASLPPGLLGNITSVARCTTAQAAADACPATSKVGTATAKAGQSTVPGNFAGDIFLTDAPDAAAFAGLFIRVPVVVGPIVVDTLKVQAGIRLRTDYGIDVVSAVPTTVRGLQLDLQQLALSLGGHNGFFLTNPSTCTGNTVAGTFGSSLGTAKSASSAMSVTGCGSLAFAPTLGFTPTPASAGGSSSLAISVGFPAGAQSAAKKISVVLPAGVSLSPSAGSDGNLVGCTDAQFTKNDFASPTCPAGSNIGTVTMQTPSVGAINGTVYLGSAVSGHTARVLVDATSTAFGAKVRVKLEGTIDVNPTTGAVTTVFDNLPPVNFTSFVLSLRGGTSPVLSMPRTCVTASGSSVMTPYSGGTDATPSGSITLSTNCADAASFAPTMTSVASPLQAAASTTLTTTVNVPERHRALNKIDLKLPAGMLANIAGMTRCSIASATAGTCAAATRIGSVDALAGQGSAPGAFAGDLYLTDAPNAGDVVGIAVKLPAIVGPIDLGNVITIASVKLRPADYGIDAIADVPTGVQGVPLLLRQLKLTIDKANFLTNPVTCTSTPITSTLTSEGGSTATPSAAYQATGCTSLAFNPSLSFSATPAAAAGASAFTTAITAPAGGAALKKAVVDLPTGTSLSSSINSASDLVGCTAVQFAPSTFADPSCPAGSVIGTASIDVPQVGNLTGNLVIADQTPSGAIAGLYLDAKSPTFGSAVRVKLEGKVDVDAATGKTTATFDNAPAVAFTSFQLTLRGGANPAISVPRTCGTPSGAAALTPQSGAAVSRSATLTIDQNCGNATSFGATGSIALSDLRAGQDTQLTTTVNVPAGHRELGKVAISLPAGLLAKIDGAARCTVVAAQAGTCSAASEIGTISATAGQGTTPGTFGGGKAYLVDAPSASDIVGIGLSLPVQVGPVDLGKVNVVASVKLRADYGIDITADVPTQVKGIPMYLRGLTIAITKSGFLFNPSTCGAKTSTLGLTSAAYGGATSTASAPGSFTITNCDTLAFSPAVAFSASPAKAGGSGALTTRLTLPISPAQSALKTAAVQLPAGVSLSPSIDSAGGLTGCTTAQFDQPTPTSSPTCPAASKIGTTTIQTSSVGSLAGDVFLASSAPGHLAGVYVYAASATYPGARVKMTGVVDVDEATGIASAVFADAPEVPFTQFDLTFRGGTNPVLSLPRTCGTPSGSAAITSHAGGATVNSSAALTIDQNCGAPGFAPAVTVTSSPTTAAAPTSLTTQITLPEGQQELSRVRLSLPAGLLAKVDGHARCSLAAATAGTCGASSKVGTLSAKAGQGTTPATFSGGSVYLTDAPGAGDLVGLAVELPVKVGSAGGNAIVDLGKVTAVGGISLRTDYGIDLDITVPTKVKGIPMYLRELTLAINESGFMVNPATCAGLATTGTLNAVQGGSAAVNAALTVSGCGSVGFNPSVAFSAAPARPAASSAFTTTITVPGTTLAPVKTAAVTLPQGVSLSASANAGGDLVGCSAAQFDQATWAEPTCPAGSKVGTVTIQTPSVGAVTGDAYLAAVTPNGTTATLLLDARSAAFGAKARIKVSGPVTVDAATGSTVATFDGLPAVAFSSFALTLRGGTNPVMSLPRACGTFPGSAVLTPHTGSAANRTGSLVLDQSCPAAGQFGPQVDFELSPSGAGESGKLTTTIAVPGGDQELSRVRLDMPEGLTAKLKGAPRCTIANAQLDACAANTELGTVVAKVGVDGAPYPQSGKVYLTEGRPGNVAGMAIVLPAVVGPIDLGKVITIADVQLRSPDLALQITADVPTTVKGVRLDLRELKLAITKDDFLLNPSSCGTLPGTASFTSAGGQTAADTANITIPSASCIAQTFDPQISFSAGNPRPGESSDFTTSVSLPNGPGAESPFESVTVRLPEGMSLSASADARGDLDGCTDAQFKQDDLAAASSCPAGSEIGTVKFETDLVGDLDGKAYLAPATSGNLARVFLETTAVDVPNLTVRVIGKVNVNETTGATDAVFDSVPAIPVTRFTVTFRGGDAPPLALPRLCGTAQGTGTFVPVNGSATQVRNAGLVLNTACPDAGAFAPTVSLGRSTQAAGRSMTFTTTVDVPAKQQELSSLAMALPAGLLGKISSVPACSVSDANAGTCGAASKVGTVTAQVGVATAPFTVDGAAYLVKGDADSIARLAIVLPAKVGPVDLGNIITLAELKLRGDYGLDITAAEIPTRVKGVRVDLHRLVLAIDRPDFMVNPVSCAPAAGTTSLSSAQGGSQQRTQPFNTDACDQLKLNASLGFGAAPASPMTSSSVTTQIRAAAPAADTLDAIKNLRVTMPEGLSLSPSAGAGGDLAECSPGEFKASDISVDAACPAGSKVGTVVISSPMVGELTGDAYLGAKSDGHFAGLYLQAKAAEYPSLRVKIAGMLDVDASTGRLTADFNDLPQVQVSAIDLVLRGGSAPVLSLPRSCGTFAADVNVLRHGGGASDATGALVLDQDCPDPNAFAPSIGLSVAPTQAAASTALVTTVNVPARHQELTSLDLVMPNGLLGRLTVVPRCSLDAARANACGAESLIGTATAKVGVASAPFTVQGKVFMTDGFDGSIAGLMFALPAKVGPIDLGTVVTLAQIKLTGNDLQMRITANGIPTRVKGIPLSISELAIGIDKPGVVLNASSCAAAQATATFGSSFGSGHQASAGYQATGCAGLDWKPDLKVSFNGPASEIKVKGHPTLTTVIEQTEGQGNLRTADVTLPDGVATDLTNINARVCESAAAASAGSCPAKSQIGSAEIRTSALPEPVDAALYIVKIPGATLPGVAIRVRDQIDFDIVGTTKLAKSGRLVANFTNLPDTPISKMTLIFNGGSTGILQLGKEICGVGGVQTDGILTALHGAQKTFAVPVECNGKSTPLGTGTDPNAKAFASATFRPNGSSTALTFALSNPNGISKIVLRMPKGAIFTKKAAKMVKLSLTGAKAKTVVVNGERRMAIGIKPLVAGQKVTKVKFKLPSKAIKINIKVRRVLENKKTSKKRKAKLLAKLLAPSITVLDGSGTSSTVKLKVAVSAKQ